jgi:biotin carboxylase
LQIVEAASELCRVLWLLDESVPENAFNSRLLRKVGTVLNVAGKSPQETVALLKEHSPDGVVTYRDEDIVPLSVIAAELGLDFHTPEVARRLVDKLVQRDTLRKGGLASPDCWQVPADHEQGAVETLAAAVRFPAVLKPRSGSGGQYTMPVADASDLARKLVELPPGAGGTTGMMVEEFIPSIAPDPGERFAGYVSVESLVALGKISHFALTGRFPLAEPFRETGFFIPAELAPADLASVLELATDALQALGVKTGGFHTEIKLTPDGPRVLEVNGRLGGGVPEMLSQASGVSLMRLSMRVALGEAIEVDGPIACSKIGWAFLFQPPASARRFVSIEGLDRLSELPGVNRVLSNRNPGDAIDLWDGTRHYVYSVYGVSPDYTSLLEIDRFLHEEVVVVYE